MEKNETTERKQVKSRQRVRDHGEVFTAEREVKAMCDLVGDVGSNPTSGTVLEPACGNGNFLVEILERKFDRLDASGWRMGGRSGKWCWQLSELYAFRAATVLTLLYGIDLLPDNVAECRQRLQEIALVRFDAVAKGRDAASRALLEKAADVILGINIVCGDALTFRAETAPLVFVKWRAEEDGDRFAFGITPYYFETLVNGEEHGQGDLFSAKPLLDRSPQIRFSEIEKVKEFLP